MLNDGERVFLTYRRSVVDTCFEWVIYVQSAKTLRMR